MFDLISEIFHQIQIHQSLDILEKKVTLIASVFLKLWTLKDALRKMSKKPGFRASFDSQHAKKSQTLMKSSRQHFDHISSSLLGR